MPTTEVKCDNCKHYNRKVYGRDNFSAGKCFAYYPPSIGWVQGDHKCSRFAAEVPDEDGLDSVDFDDTDVETVL